MPDPLHSIQLAARRTRLSTHVIRIWELRYRAVEPHRTAANHRLYSQDDINRLGLLRDATRAGHNISHMERLSNDELRALAANAPILNEPAANEPAHDFKPLSLPVANSEPEAPLDECLACVRSLDAGALDHALKRASFTLGAQGVLYRLIAPLTQRIGELWREGKITAAHEHFATGCIRTYLTSQTKPYGGSVDAPVLLVTTPAGQLHEMGALLVD